MSDTVTLQDLERELSGVRYWARDVAIEGPWPDLARGDGSNWKVDVYPRKRPPITSCISVSDAVEALRQKLPTVRWE